jgi:integrase
VLTSRIWLPTTCIAPVLGCHLAGGELEQIQFLLGHASVQTTERYFGCKQKLGHAVNDNLGLEDS